MGKLDDLVYHPFVDIWFIELFVVMAMVAAF